MLLLGRFGNFDQIQNSIRKIEILLRRLRLTLFRTQAARLEPNE